MSWLHSQQSNIVFTVPILSEGTLYKIIQWVCVMISLDSSLPWLWSHRRTAETPQSWIYEMARHGQSNGQWALPHAGWQQTDRRTLGQCRPFVTHPHPLQRFQSVCRWRWPCPCCRPWSSWLGCPLDDKVWWKLPPQLWADPACPHIPQRSNQSKGKAAIMITDY